MRSAELSQQANAILVELERHLRAEGFRFGWHRKDCLIIARSCAEAEQARHRVDVLLTQFGGSFRASGSSVKILPNGFAMTEFALLVNVAARRRKRRKSTRPHLAQCTKGCVLRK